MRFIRRRINPGLGFFSFNTARRTIGGYKVMNMIRKGRLKGWERRHSPEAGTVAYQKRILRRSLFVFALNHEPRPVIGRRPASMFRHLDLRCAQSRGRPQVFFQHPAIERLHQLRGRLIVDLP